LWPDECAAEIAGRATSNERQVIAANTMRFMRNLLMAAPIGTALGDWFS
jgi:hypothetical protein